MNRVYWSVKHDFLKMLILSGASVIYYARFMTLSLSLFCLYRTRTQHRVSYLHEKLDLHVVLGRLLLKVLAERVVALRRVAQLDARHLGALVDVLKELCVLTLIFLLGFRLLIKYASKHDTKLHIEVNYKCEFLQFL